LLYFIHVPYSTAIVRIRQTKRYLTSWLSHDSAGLAVIVTGAKMRLWC
jgi:hypothetical protein